MLLMGLAVAVTYPALSRGSASLELRAAGRDVLNIFRYAREKAITEGIGSRVVVERETGRITLADAYGTGERWMKLRTGVMIAGLAVNGAEVLGGPLVVRFLPNGSTERAEVMLRSASGALLRIVTDPITGGARVESQAELGRERRMP
jgi:Tfp pilus assembly protein FimT